MQALRSPGDADADVRARDVETQACSPRSSTADVDSASLLAGIHTTRDAVAVPASGNPT